MDVAKWFAALVREFSQKERGAEMVEILSDASAEGYLNAITACHLRAFGRKTEGAGFWVRSEWTKTDISYGLTKSEFGTWDDWDEAWRNGDTGDLGQIETKVLYCHYTPSQRHGALTTLVAQLEQRRRADRGREHQQYHGLVWLFRHGLGTEDVSKKDVGEEIRETGDETVQFLAPRRLVAADGAFAPVARQDLGEIWPTVRGRYIGHLSCALFKLHDAK